MRKKLILNKERITELSEEQSASVRGGGTGGSTERNFTCCWCTSATSSDTCMNTCGESVPAQGDLCPPDHTIIQ